MDDRSEEQRRWAKIDDLNESLLLGGVRLSEWANFIACEAELAYVKSAHLPAILTSVSAIETHLRCELGGKRGRRFVELIDAYGFESSFCQRLHKLRMYRNRWVHVDNPEDDYELQVAPEIYQKELEEVAWESIVCMLEVLYDNQWV